MNSEVLDKEVFSSEQSLELYSLIKASIYDGTYHTIGDDSCAKLLDIDPGVFKVLANNSGFSVNDIVGSIMEKEVVISAIKHKCPKNRALYFNINNTKEKNAEIGVQSPKVEFDITYKNNISGDELNENNHDININNGITVRSGPTSSE